MESVVFNRIYAVEGDVIAVVLCLVVNALLRSTYTVKKTNLRLFQAANLLVGSAAISSMIYHALIDNISQDKVFFIYLFCMITEIALIWTFVCYCVYVKQLIDMGPKFQNVFIISVYGAGVLATILEVISPFMGWGFYIDENLVIYQNFYFDVFRYVYIYFVLNIAFMLVLNRKKFITKTFRCICVVMAIAIALMCFQESCMETSYTTVTFAIPIIGILFLFHYNSYDLRTGTMDQYAFQHHVRDLSEKKKNFSLIFLSLPTISEKGLKKFSQDLLRRNDNFYKDSCCFRID